MSPVRVEAAKSIKNVVGNKTFLRSNALGTGFIVAAKTSKQLFIHRN